MDWLIYVAVFVVGALVVTGVFYLTFNPRMLATESGEVDLVLIGRTLLMIVLTSVAVAAMLMLGRYYVYTPPAIGGP
ncbi:hypothetical protein Ocepr_0296 [Oceanithermus profundus DSM 14977]|uniref:Cytochrome oxidase Caa3-type subunit IV domain-containing protein n=1 Tax=Oceanithermus profundus (strain DSM 14977 / NBRC 100410 / VKM B-2274 / 506) TaxID=670487 RepID=E4U6L8_OCEP5|nr:hypothetical protein [Oceanithermus profundus]ADR35756.1 hypothetical protein Ocepr_0296 [Oceanithermus profundus DSM 14977]